MQKPGRVKKGLIDHKVSLDVKSDPGWPLIYPKLPDLISMLAASPDWEFVCKPCISIELHPVSCSIHLIRRKKIKVKILKGKLLKIHPH